MAAPLVFGALLGKEIIGETIEGGFRLAAASISAAGSVAGGALNAAGSIIGGAAAGATAPAPVTIVKGAGVVGQVGKSKITGTPPAPRLKTGGPTAVNDNMPVGQLLVTAVNYLSSIDSTLKEQIKFEYQMAQKQSLAEREAAVEDTRGGTFTQLRDRLSTAKDTASRAKSLIKPLLAATGLAGLAAIGISQLDTSELDRLKQNWQNFQDQFGWLIPLGTILSGAYIGSRLGGGPGAIAGALAAAIIPYLFGGGGEGNDGVGISGGLATLGIIGAGGLGLSSARRGVRGFNERRARLRAQTGTRGVAATHKSFFGGPKWKRFEKWLAKKGKRKLLRKIQLRIALLGTAAIATATGVGAVLGILMTLFNVGMSIFLIYEIYDLWRQWETEEEDTVTDAEAVAEGQPDAAAIPATRITSKSETGRPEEAQAFFESKGWSPEQAAGIVGNLVVESGLKTDAVGDGGKAYGIAQWHPDRQARFKKVYGKDIKNSSFQEQLEYVNWELNNSEAAAGRRLRGATSAEDAAAIVDQYYERSAGIHRQQRMANASAIMSGNYANLQGGGGGGFGGMAGSLGDIAIGVGRAAARIVKAASGEYKPRRLTESLNQDKAAAIGSMSSSISNMTNFGTNSEKIKENETASSIISALRNTAVAAGEPTVGALDPNYKNRDVVDDYLQYFNMKAA